MTSTGRIVAIVLSGLLLAHPALAGKGGGNGGGGYSGHGSSSDYGDSSRYEREYEYRHENEYRRENDDHERRSGEDHGGLRIRTEERETIRAFLGEEKTKLCPPGLAKKGNGCTPPGLARRHRAGEILGNDVVCGDLPERIRARLSHPGEGHKYVVVDDEVLLIAEGTRMILDAVGLDDDD